MIEERRASPPHGAILAAVVLVAVIVPFLIGDPSEAATGFFAELLTPVGLLLLPTLLLLTIHFLSSDRGSFVTAVLSGEPNSFHRATGSPIGIALFVLLVLFLLFIKLSFFGGGGDSED